MQATISICIIVNTGSTNQVKSIYTERIHINGDDCMNDITKMAVEIDKKFQNNNPEIRDTFPRIRVNIW